MSGPKPHMIMLVGLQGAGKTTTAGKLAKQLRSQGERVLLVAADPYRPAAVQQLQTLGENLGVDVLAEEGLLPNGASSAATTGLDPQQIGRIVAGVLAELQQRCPV